ncbi:DUF4396 domain-containing protein [Haloarchaeobius sp. DT45]|uniref:DUF4396 domain-containing protein n=1 Tax=Haloarchaeobius sp. DT45 TaxID=3446116 RepID=UPI003F6D9D23
MVEALLRDLLTNPAVLAGEAAIVEPLFWASLVVSLSVGLLVAYPVNVFLVHQGVKDGMQNPASLSG